MSSPETTQADAPTGGESTAADAPAPVAAAEPDAPATGDAPADAAPAAADAPKPEPTEDEKKAAAKAELEKRTAKREAAQKSRAAKAKAERERQEKIAARERELAAFEEAKQAKNPFEALKKLGYTEEQIIDAMAEASGEEKSEADKQAERIAKLEAEREAEKAEAKRKQDEAAMAERKAKAEAGAAKVIERIKADGSKYAYVNASDTNRGLVLATAREYIREHGQPCDYETAVTATEQYLEGLIGAIAETEKFKAKFQPVVAAPPEPEKTPKTLGKNGVARNGAGAGDGLSTDWRERMDQLIERSN